MQFKKQIISQHVSTIAILLTFSGPVQILLQGVVGLHESAHAWWNSDEYDEPYQTGPVI